MTWALKGVGVISTLNNYQFVRADSGISVSEKIR